MKIEEFLRMEREKIYLKTANGMWKKFDNVLKDVLSEKVIKLKKRRFQVHGRLLGEFVTKGRMVRKFGSIQNYHKKR